MPRTERGRELARRRTRKAKLAKLRGLYSAAKSDADKQVIFEKARKISPFIELEPAKAS